MRRAATNASASRAIAVKVAGTVPLDPATPALSKRMTSRSAAIASTSAGSQLSRLPRKCMKNSTGGAPRSALPNRR
jgi:hypothetical protein